MEGFPPSVVLVDNAALNRKGIGTWGKCGV